MYEFFSQHSIYVVFFVVLLIWLGIAAFLFGIDSKISKLEKKIKIMDINKQ